MSNIFKPDFSSCNPNGPGSQYVSAVRDALQNIQARDFLLKHGQYVELFDDIIDIKDDKDTERLMLFSRLAIEVQNHPYYVKYRENLLPILLLENLTYYDAVKWEQSNSEWKRRDARVLSHFSINVLYAVLIIEVGFDNALAVSNTIREHLHSWSLFNKPGAYYSKNGDKTEWKGND